ncbi:hypothetical protein AXF42_Ash016973 [Apostasia shenzhenica]|uniref:Uncharacterized protein n=1 Tax=Apostasia shenzhenica TaxID=1088818 RepID=A0A2I0B7D4_9ASPA|nr:hypothetical protein AXF42_Ash016973 [Apostasia shenzhenica]
MSRRVHVLRDVNLSAFAVRDDTSPVRLGYLAHVETTWATTWTVRMKRRESNCNTINK